MRKPKPSLRLALKYAKQYSAPYIHMITLLFEAKLLDEQEIEVIRQTSEGPKVKDGCSLISDYCRFPVEGYIPDTRKPAFTL